MSAPRDKDIAKPGVVPALEELRGENKKQWHLSEYTHTPGTGGRFEGMLHRMGTGDTVDVAVTGAPLVGA